MVPVSLIVIGAGQRGAGYARWARRHPDRASVVAVAEPNPSRRARLAAEHAIPAGNVAADWRELAGRGRLADAVLICTQDRMHAEPAEAFAALGYHILLEKPMAPDEAGCRRIVAAVEKAGVMLAVGHVLRYTPYTRAVKEIVAAGQLGDIMRVQHLEPVGFWQTSNFSEIKQILAEILIFPACGAARSWPAARGETRTGGAGVSGLNRRQAQHPRR